MPQPREITRTAEELIRVYVNAWQRIVEEQEAILGDPRRFRRRARLNELRTVVEEELDRLGVVTRGWLRTRLPQVYAAGADAALRQVGGQAFTWTTLHREAIQRLATDTFDDLLAATEYVRRDTKRFIREVAKLATERTLTTGRTAQQAARTVRDLLREHGITAVVYKNGARHGLGDYSDMLLRTKTAQAYNLGTINTATERGFTRFEIFDGPGCGLTAHAAGPEANGMVVDADTALAWPLSHPRCQRAFSASVLAPAAERPQGRFTTPRPARTARRPRTPRVARAAALAPAGAPEEQEE